MKINELTTRALRSAIRATERVAGPDSLEAKALRRELARRTMRRDIQAEHGGGHVRTGEPQDTVSMNGGVCPASVAEANADPAYRKMGVRFDSDGNAHIPGGRQDEFYKHRGVGVKNGPGGGMSRQRYADLMNQQSQR